MANSITSAHTEIFMSFVGRDGSSLNTYGYGPYEQIGIAKRTARAEINGRNYRGNSNEYYFVVKQLKPYIDDDENLALRWETVFDSRDGGK